MLLSGVNSHAKFVKCIDKMSLLLKLQLHYSQAVDCKETFWIFPARKKNGR